MFYVKIIIVSSIVLWPIIYNIEHVFDYINKNNKHNKSTQTPPITKYAKATQTKSTLNDYVVVEYCSRV